ncbi:putative outer membrane protein [unidentified eubacterium SCB49]|nr:putative outer membrane protein [unidentified eubacterium SCB49]
MLKKILVTVCICVISATTFAQEGTTSPYSFYGVGSLNFKGTAENRMMGGLGVYSDSIHLNMQNPAGLAGLKLTTFSVGASHKYSKQKSNEGESNAATTSLDYLAIGIPMGKFGASFGLVPYTAVGYNLTSSGDFYNTLYTGDGGLNRAFLSLAYSITENLSVGIETNYNFGEINNTALITSANDEFEYATREINESDLSGFNYTLGLSYQKLIDNNLQLMGSLTYTPSTNLNSENYRDISSVIISSITGATATLYNEEVIVEDTKFDFPSQYTIGAGIGAPKNWFVGLEYTNQKTSNFTNRTFVIDNVVFKDASKVRLGGFYVPNYNGIGKYWQRVVYRAGIRAEETGLVVNGEDINEFGISFGVGLPAGKLFTNINLGFEIGSRGTTNAGLIKENFFNTFLSLSLNDKWFEKRYYD